MARTKMSKSARVKEFIESNPDAKPKQVADACGVKTSLVYNIRSSMARNGLKRAAAKKVVKRRPASSQKKATAKSAATDNESILEGAAFVRSCGGFQEARQILETLEKIADTVR